MLRGHLSAWVTAAFALLLLLVTITDQGQAGATATLVLLVLAVGVMGLFTATERAVHRGKH